jgi:hypothetical protein
MKKLTNDQMSKTHGGLFGLFLFGLLCGYVLALMVSDDNIVGNGGLI